MKTAENKVIGIDEKAARMANERVRTGWRDVRGVILTYCEIAETGISPRPRRDCNPRADQASQNQNGQNRRTAKNRKGQTMESKKTMYALRMFAPAADYGIGIWRTKSKRYAKRVAAKRNKFESEHGFSMRYEVVEVKA